MRSYWIRWPNANESACGAGDASHPGSHGSRTLPTQIMRLVRRFSKSCADRLIEGLL
jgi:hypothetical protein